jgi:anaerobic selenocysteine-containing dehydrogenase
MTVSSEAGAMGAAADGRGAVDAAAADALVGDPTASASNDADGAARTAFPICPLCEAGCGLEATVVGDAVLRIRGNRRHVFSHGFLCPKGSTLKQLHEDPDRLRGPMVRRDGRHVEVTWAEAWDEVDRRLSAVIAERGREALAVYIGNPTAHNMAAAMYLRPLLQALGTRNRFSASTVDQAPKQVAAGYLFGTAVSVAVPDLDRTDHVLMLGANPYASNGSLCTAPDFPGRLEAMRARGGRLVVVDPRRSRTAQAADEWVPILPGTDAHLLMGMVHVLFADGRADPGPHVAPWVEGVDELAALSRPFTPEATARVCGIDADTVRRLAHELADAPTAAVYGRIGTCTQAYGTTASWLVDVLNLLTGNLDRRGGAMFARPAAGGPTTRGGPRVGSGFRIGRGRTRVRGLPEVMGEYPAVALAEEIDTPGDGQIRALVTLAGNPVCSTPNSARLDAALPTLDLMVSVDLYLNETTRHADVILPPPSPLQRPHFDLLLMQFAVRNVASFSPAVLPVAPGQPEEWEIFAMLTALAAGRGPQAEPAAVDEAMIAGLVRHAVADPSSPVHGRDADELLDALSATGRTGPERVLDLMLRTGPYGEGFGTVAGGISLDVLLEHPHGIDLGPLEPRLPEILRTPSGGIELAHPALVADVDRLVADLEVATRPDRGFDGGPRRRPTPQRRRFRGRRSRRRRSRRSPETPPVGRSTGPAVQQLLDAQRGGAGEGPAPLHAPAAPVRRRPVRARRWRRRGGHLQGRPADRARRGHERHPARRREPASRLGP